MNAAASPSRLLAGAAIAFAIAFNVPFTILGMTFEYPDVLRRPAGEVLTLFHAGGVPLVLTWHAFAIAAFLLAPLAIALSLRADRMTTAPALSVGAAIAGALAGLAQAIGLWRWVFVVPSLAAVHADPNVTDAAKLAAEQTFSLINLYGGVAVGEHIGQLFTALFVTLLAAVQMREGSRVVAWIGFAAAAAIVVGTNEGLAIALGRSGEIFSLATIGGFVGLSAWLIATGIAMLMPAASTPMAGALASR